MTNFHSVLLPAVSGWLDDAGRQLAQLLPGLTEQLANLPMLPVIALFFALGFSGGQRGARDYG